MDQIEETPVMTPLGPATAFAIITGLMNPIWVVWQDRTQECWWWDSRHVRRRITPSTFLATYSPFTNVGGAHWRHINRYKDAGWLPPRYNPEDVSTWPT